ncbi:MAG: hypothetical protein DWP98_13820 [Bacteroidetes bacterium]|nr:MAG: hypothetical protein DWP98_13820 [Bacteroidota bacterium]MBL1144833.1 hypothetical protein [Bacteroidota bacterium]NOG57627.1 hypothetical protein [Bacteroidota bacterium]
MGKKYITIAFLLFSVICFAQEGDKKVTENDQKIGELNERLDRLIGGSAQISGDSISLKIDRLISDIKEIKSEMQELKKTVQKLDVESQTKLNKIDNKISEVENGKYYVVISSERELKRAKSLLKNLQKKQEVQLFQNKRKTWYHVVIAIPFSMQEAIKENAKQHQLGYKDSWWVTSKKLVEVD